LIDWRGILCPWNFGVDPMEGAIKVADAIPSNGDIRFQTADGERLPFDDRVRMI
jgi:hypothetical protein